MLTEVRYIYVPSGGSPNYEMKKHDRKADHQSFAGLMKAVSLPDKKVIAIEQRGVPITDETYDSIQPHLHVAVVCTDANSRKCEFNQRAHACV